MADHRRDGAGRSGSGAGRQPICEARTLRGEPCRSFALGDRPYCMSHDPERAGDVRRARARGGAAASKVRALKGRRDRLDTPGALVRFTSGVIQDVLDGTVPPDVARAVLYGLSIQRQLVEAGDLERRLTSLERQLAPEQARRGGGQSWGT